MNGSRANEIKRFDINFEPCEEWTHFNCGWDSMSLARPQCLFPPKMLNLKCQKFFVSIEIWSKEKHGQRRDDMKLFSIMRNYTVGVVDKVLRERQRIIFKNLWSNKSNLILINPCYQAFY